MRPYRLKWIPSPVGRIGSAWLWLAHRLPRTLVYWATIRLLTEATSGEWEDQVVPELQALTALERWRIRRP